MDQKVTERVLLPSDAVDPVNDILPVVDVSAGLSGSKKISIDALFKGWGMTPTGESLAKAPDLQGQKNVLGITLEFDPAITGLTGGGPTRLDGIPTVGTPADRLRLVYDNGRLSFYIGKIGGIGENAPRIINADDQSAGYYWELVDLTVDVLRTLQVMMTSDDKTRTVTLAPGSADEVSDPYLHVQNTPGSTYIIYFPASGGLLGLERTMRRYLSPTSGTALFVGGTNDEFISISSLSTLDLITLNLPNNGFARNGQEVVFHTKSALTNLAFNPGVGNIIEGALPLSMAAGRRISFVYSSNDATWICLP